MGDIQTFTSAGADDSGNTITMLDGAYGRVSDFFVTKVSVAAMQTTVDTVRADVTTITDDAPSSLDTFKEVSDEMDVDDFQDALG